MLAFLINCKLWQLWDFLWFNFRELYFQILGNLQPLKWTSFFYLLTNDFVFCYFLTHRWSITPMMYPASFLFREASTAFVVLILLNLFLGITCTVTVSILQLFPKDPVCYRNQTTFIYYLSIRSSFSQLKVLNFREKYAFFSFQSSKPTN